VNYYWDSSALCKLFMDEEHSDAAHDFFVKAVESDRVVVSFLTNLETTRVLRRAGLDPSKALTVLGGLPSIEVSSALLTEARDIPPHELRSLDAIHLACATSLKTAGVSLVSYDKQLLEAARYHGVDAISPGL
jgi:uncharacterized protein